MEVVAVKLRNMKLKMEALTNAWSANEVQSVTIFTCLKKTPLVEIHHQQVKVYEKKLMQRKQNWFVLNKFQKGRIDMRDEKR